MKGMIGDSDKVHLIIQEQQVEVGHWGRALCGCSGSLAIVEDGLKIEVKKRCLKCEEIWKSEQKKESKMR